MSLKNGTMLVAPAKILIVGQQVSARIRECTLCFPIVIDIHFELKEEEWHLGEARSATTRCSGSGSQNSRRHTCAAKPVGLHTVA